MGASLLAKALDQLTWMATGMASSRAGSLPQLDRGQSCNQVGCQAASFCFCSALAFDFLAPPHPEPVRQPMTTATGASTNVDPCRIEACGRLFSEYISISAVTAAYGFALTATHFFKHQKVSKRLCPTTWCLAVARHALSPALLRGSPRWAIHGPARLNRRPAGFPTAQCLRSAIVVNGAPRSKTKARRP